MSNKTFSFDTLTGADYFIMDKKFSDQIDKLFKDFGKKTESVNPPAFTMKYKSVVNGNFEANDTTCRYTYNIPGIDKTSLKVEIDPNERLLNVSGKLVIERLSGKEEVVDDFKRSYVIDKKWNIDTPIRQELKDGVLYIDFGLNPQYNKRVLNIKM